MTRIRPTSGLDDVIELLARLQVPGTDPAHPDQPVAEVVTRRMEDARRGHPGSSMGGGGIHSGGSPVEALLDQRDIGGEDLARWTAALVELRRAAVTLDRLAIAWAPRPPSTRDVLATEAANTRVCECCHDGALRADAPTDVRGNLAEPLRLCRWCYDFAASTGRLPDQRTLERRRNGQRIRVSA